MVTESQRLNAVFNKNKLKLGTFATNTVGGIHTSAPDGYRPTWENSLQIGRAHV